MPVQNKIADAATGLTRRSLGWYLFFRLLTITLLFVATFVYLQQNRGERLLWSLPWLYWLIALSYAQNLLATLWLPRIKRPHLFVRFQVVVDLGLATLLIYLSGGVASPFPFLYILIILSVATLASRRESLIAAAQSAILYGGLLDLQYYGYVTLQSLGGAWTTRGGDDFLYAVFVHTLAFFVTAFLGGVLAERLRSSEQALKRKEIDYDELDALNRTIVETIGSGLMTLNHQGRIRVFNRGAEKITGLSLVEVYDRDVRELFPDMVAYDGNFILNSRGEGSLAHPDGKRRYVGFATSLISSAQGGEAGLLVTFQDLTRLKEAEELSRRNDRLAAVGQLAAGMAHEIRNPLASISGSVQLLLESGGMSSDNQRLMRIVVKEATRLSHLLDDFLRFARPSAPMVEAVDVSAMLDELGDMALADARFASVAIERDYPSAVVLRCDRNQLRQALLNLLLNAVDAMPEGGAIRLGIDPAQGALVVEDTGPGIPRELREQVFNPFFTTRENGTGLGLATVHAIMEAHSGSVTIDTGRDGGARFVLRLGEPS